MNQQQCKRLRRWAEALTVGQPAVSYTTSRGGAWKYITRKYITRRLEGSCTQAIYQGMKDSQIRKARGLE